MTLSHLRGGGIKSKVQAIIKEAEKNIADSFLTLSHFKGEGEIKSRASAIFLIWLQLITIKPEKFD